MNSPSNSDAYGLALPSRRANVTVTRRSSVHSDTEGEDAVAPLSRDSLEGTRRYYNIESSPAIDRGGSPRVRKTSAHTLSARPLSVTPSESSFSLRSPPRGGSAPLPVPRGFLAPQKPAAARRLEQRERSTTVSTSGRASTDVRPSMSTDMRPSGEYSELPTPALSTPGLIGTPTMSDFSDFTATSSTRAGTTAFGNAGVGLGLNSFGSGSLGGPSRSPSSSQVPSHLSQSIPTESKGTSLPPPRRPGVAIPRREVIDARSGAEPTTPRRSEPDSVGHSNWERQTDSSSPSHGHGLRPDMSSDRLVDTLGFNEKRASVQRKASPGRESLVGEAMTRSSQRNYQRFENTSTTFFCGGRMMTGGDTPLSFIVSIVLLLGIAGVWIGTTGAWLWVNGTEYGLASGGGIAINIIFAYMFGLTVSSMIAAAFREPGILPRELDPDPPYTPVDIYWEANPREILVGREGKDRVQCKYCETCKSYRPPRASHCRLCGNCVEGIDHHCAYLHGCVGRRNYFAFLVFVIMAAVADIYIVVFSAVHFSLLCHHDGISFAAALKDSPGAAVSFLLGLITLAPLLFLFYYHVRLLLYNLTTIEQIRASASSNLFRATQRPYNPFAAKNRWTNIVRASIGRPQFPSWIDASGYALDDRRRVNPALTTPEKYLELV